MFRRLALALAPAPSFLLRSFSGASGVPEDGKRSDAGAGSVKPGTRAVPKGPGCGSPRVQNERPKGLPPPRASVARSELLLMIGTLGHPARNRSSRRSRPDTTPSDSPAEQLSYAFRSRILRATATNWIWVTYTILSINALGPRGFTPFGVP